MINDIKTVLQVICLAVLLVVLLLAGWTFYQFNAVIEDFRGSFIFQPTGPIGSLAVESLSPESVKNKVEDLTSIGSGNGVNESVDVLETLEEIEKPDILGMGGDSVESPSEAVKAGQELEILTEESSSSAPEVQVDQGNICNRTPEIQDILIEMLEIKSCREITGEELVRIRKLTLMGIPLKAGDLDGFINLTELVIQTDEAQVGLFDDLVSLEVLGAAVKSPPPTGLFQKLESLRSLSLSIEARENQESLVLEGVFEGLIDLEHLELDVRSVSDGFAVSLLKGSLTGMPQLKYFQVSSVNRIESGVFSDLPALRAASLRAIDLPEHLSKPSLPSDQFVGNPDLGDIRLNGFKETSMLEFHSLDVVCRMRGNIDLSYGVDFAIVVQGKVVEVVNYDWDDDATECTLRLAPTGTENWEEVNVTVPHLPQ